jgi:hypothetical protein
MTTEPREVTAVPVLELSAEQDAAFRAKVEQLQTIESGSRAQRIMCYYQIGKALDEVFQDRERGEVRFGANAIQRLAIELAADQSTLYRAQEVATRFTQQQIDAICTLPRVSWSHVLEVVRLPSPEQRMEILQGIPELPVTQQTVAALRARVQELRTDPAPGAAPGEAGGADTPAEPAAKAAKQRGGGSRTGTGHGNSPLTPVKRTFKQAEALAGSLGNLVIMLKEFDPDNEMVAEKVAKELDAAAGVVVEAMAQAAGAMQVIEEYVSAFNYKESVSSRKAMLSQVVQEIQSFLNGEKQAEAEVREERRAVRAETAELEGKAKAKSEAKVKVEARPARAEVRPAVKTGPRPSDGAALRAIIESRRKAAQEDLRRRT